MALTGNKGEWSEIYTLFKLLGDTKVYSGDGQLNKLDTYYPVIKILRNELSKQLEYKIDRDIVIVTEKGDTITKISVKEFLQQADLLFKKIKGKRGAFDVPEIEPFLKRIHCCKLKAKSTDKADIHIVIHDYRTGLSPELGFSIKSEAGNKSTLLNASAATNFIYRIDGKVFSKAEIDYINSISTQSKIMDRISAILRTGAKLNFVGNVNEIFEGNLIMIDSCLPKIIGYMLLDSYINRNLDIKAAVERISQTNPFHYNQRYDWDYYGYKIKALMICSALGMLPATPWDGKYEATGGYLVVKEDGDIVCFHIYDRNLLEDYLFYNTRFETPSSSAKKQHNFGKIYKGEDGNLYFNLNLQIRFK